MWIQINKKEKTENSGESSTSFEDGGQSSLPLDWTRMGGVCCDDPVACRHRAPIRPLCPKDDNDKDVSDSSKTIRGQAIFCLHEENPSWMQGYFIARGSKKPWRILAIQEEVDDCLACSEGGYRRLSLTVYPRSTAESNIRHDQKPWKKSGIDWTGGDMMSLYHPDFVHMESDRLLTGERALPMLQKYFQNLVNRLEKELGIGDSTSVLDWLPNIAISIGSMSLVRPTKQTFNL